MSQWYRGQKMPMTKAQFSHMGNLYEAAMREKDTELSELKIENNKLRQRYDSMFKRVVAAGERNIQRRHDEQTQSNNLQVNGEEGEDTEEEGEGEQDTGAEG